MKLSRFLCGALITWVFVISGCTVANLAVTPYVKITLEGGNRLNPDINDRPSPVHVKVLHLSSRATFDNLDFEQLYFNSGSLLSGELLLEKNYTLQPQEVISEKLLIDRGTQFIAIVAAFRDIDNASWRYITPVSDKSYYSQEYQLSETAIVPLSVNNRKYANKRKVKDAEQAAKDAQGVHNKYEAVSAN